MDIQQIATAAMVLLSPYLAKAGEAFAKKTGEQLTERVSKLYQAIKKKFAGDDYAEQTLTRVEEKPTSTGRQVVLKEVLAEKMEDDANFADMVRRSVEETHNAPGGDVITQQLNISGKTGDVFQVGKMSGDITKIEGDSNILGDRSSSRVERSNN